MSRTVTSSSGHGMLAKFAKKKSTCIGCRAVLDCDGKILHVLLITVAVPDRKLTFNLKELELYRAHTLCVHCVASSLTPGVDVTLALPSDNKLTRILK